MTIPGRVLSVLIAVAVAFAPLSAASAALRMHASVAQAAVAHTAYQAHHGAKSDATGVKAQAVAVMADHAAGGCCPAKSSKSDCAQSCLQKCFGPLAVMPAHRASPLPDLQRFAAVHTDRAPDWSQAPQLPPPRI